MSRTTPAFVGIAPADAAGRYLAGVDYATVRGAAGHHGIYTEHAGSAPAVPGWWRQLAVPTVLVLVWFVLFPLTTAVYATNLPPGPLGAATPASYGLAYQDVAFRAGDGVGLSAWYLPARNGAAVVLLPGAGSTGTAVLGQAADHSYAARMRGGCGR